LVNGDAQWSNLRVNSSAEALAAFQAGMAYPYWVDKLEFDE